MVLTIRPRVVRALATRSAGEAQQGVDLGLGQSHRPGIAHRSHRFELQRDVIFKQPVLMRPATESPQCFKPAVDGGRFQCLDVNEVLAVVDQVKDRQLLETRALGLGEPAQELLQVVTVAAHRGRREIIAPQTVHEIGKPTVR